MSSVILSRPAAPLASGRAAAPRPRVVVRASPSGSQEGKRQADKAKYFELQEELEKKNPERARMESKMRNSKPPTGAYGSTDRKKGADIQDKQHLEDIDKENAK